jgi:hypothetical protein
MTAPAQSRLRQPRISYEQGSPPSLPVPWSCQPRPPRRPRLPPGKNIVQVAAGDCPQFSKLFGLKKA